MTYQYNFQGIHLLSEFIGTFLIVLIGNGTCSSITFKRMKANSPAKWLVVMFGWSFAVFWGWLASHAIVWEGGPHCLNPAVTMFKMIYTTGGGKMLLLIPFQFLGAMFAQVIVDFAAWRHIVDEKRPLHLLEIHSTIPAYSRQEGGLLSSCAHEFVGSILLMSMVLILSNEKIIPKGSIIAEAFAIAAIIVVILASWASQTGASLNPARDLGPRFIYRYALIPCLIFWHRKNNKNTLEVDDFEKKLIAATNWHHGVVAASLTPMFAGLVMGLIKLASGI